MKTSEVLESMGVLLKEETLQTVDNYMLPNTLVLESLEPFPGYYGDNIPRENNPDSLFFITDKFYPVETIFRISQGLCGYHQMEFDACPADIFIFNTNLPAIRIKGLHNYSLISDLQRCYIDQGIGFLKKRKINAPGLIKITKVFSIERLSDQIYRDLADESTFYLSLPYHFNWSLFKKVTANVKNNLDNRNFDCASGFIYLTKIMEFVRIYAQHIDIEKLQIIREKYLTVVNKLQEK